MVTVRVICAFSFGMLAVSCIMYYLWGEICMFLYLAGDQSFGQAFCLVSSRKRRSKPSESIFWRTDITSCSDGDWSRLRCHKNSNLPGKKRIGYFLLLLLFVKLLQCFCVCAVTDGSFCRGMIRMTKRPSTCRNPCPRLSNCRRLESVVNIVN